MANVTSVSNQTTPIQEPPTYSEFVAAGLVTLIIGFIAIIANALTATVIFKSKDLRTPCFSIIAAHAILYSIMAIGFFTNGIELCGYAFNFLSIAHSRLKCYFMYITMLVTTPASSVLSCYLGIDRMLAILYPLVYRKLGISFVVGCLLLATAVGCGATVAAGLTLPAPVSGVIMCFNFKSAFHPTYTAFQTNFNLCCYLLAICFYVAIVVIVKHKKLCKNGVNSEVERFRQRQLKLLPLINALALLYALFGLVPAFLSIFFAGVAEGRYVQRAWYYGSMLKVCLSCVDFFILCMKSSKFRQTFRQILGIGNQVVPINIVPLSANERVTRVTTSGRRVTCYGETIM